MLDEAELARAEALEKWEAFRRTLEETEDLLRQPAASA